MNKTVKANVAARSFRHLEMRQWRNHLAFFVLAVGALTALIIAYRNFGGSTPKERPQAEVTHVSYAEIPSLKNIEDIEVGEWVHAQNPSLKSTRPIRANIATERCRRLLLRVSKEDGTSLEIELLRDLFWIEKVGASVGGSIELHLEEFGAEGPAQVLDILPCPELVPRPNQHAHLVTGTFHHESADLIDVYISELSEPIGVTASHLFYSIDRNGFVPASRLQVRERLHSHDNREVVVAAIRPRDGPEAVFNLEVETQHVYEVTSLGVLVHNSCLDGEEFIYRLLDDQGEVVYYGIAKGMDNLIARLRFHNSEKVFSSMQVIGRNLSHDAARTLEGALIRRAITRSGVDESLPIVRQLEEAGLINMNRGRLYERWLQRGGEAYIPWQRLNEVPNHAIPINSTLKELREILKGVQI